MIKTPFNYWKLFQTVSAGALLTDLFAAYLYNGFTAPFVADFENEVYAKAVPSEFGPDLVAPADKFLTKTFNDTIDGVRTEILTVVPGRPYLVTADVTLTGPPATYQYGIWGVGQNINVAQGSSFNYYSEDIENGVTTSVSQIVYPFNSTLAVGARLGNAGEMTATLENATVREVVSFAPEASTFDELLTYTGASNKTMVDSDGALKWAPHNFVAASDNLTDAFWRTRNSGVRIDANTFSVGTGSLEDVYTNTLFSGALNGATAKFTLWSETDAGSPIDIILAMSGGGNTVQTITLQSTPTEYTLVSPPVGAIPYTGAQTIVFRGAGVAVTAKLEKVRAFRSDFGGMVNNPDTGDSYVPTTGTARYLPRRGHHVFEDGEWVNKGIQIESEARTNLVTFSNKFTDASWASTGAGVTVTENTSVSPDGAVNADSMFNTTGSGQHLLRYNATVAAGSLSGSFYVKRVNYDRVTIRIFDSAVGSRWAVFNLLTGVVTFEGTDVKATIKPAGNGWYRITSSIPSAGGSGFIEIGFANVDAYSGASFAGSATDEVLIYGAQLEQAAAPSSYIPTAGAQVTRAAETLKGKAANLPYNTSAVSYAMKSTLTYADLDASVQIRLFQQAVDDNNRIITYLDTSAGGTGAFRFQVRNSGSFMSVLQGIGSLSPGVNVPVNVAARTVSGSLVAFAQDGTEEPEVAGAITFPAISAEPLEIGATGFNGTISQVLMWGDDIGDTGTSEATA